MPTDTLASHLPPPPPLAQWLDLAPHPSATAFDPRRILVTGLASPAAFSIAAAYPAAAVTAWDGDPVHIALATETVHALDLRNLTLETATLPAPPPPASFDWIHVPHPLPAAEDEVAPWRRLASLLAPAGLLTLRGRSRYQEYWGDELREAVAVIAEADPSGDLESWMGIGRQIVQDLARGGTRLGAVAREAEARFSAAPPLEAALVLLPAPPARTLVALRSLLAQAGLALIGALNPDDWEAGARLADPELDALAAALPAADRYELADILRAPDHLLVCGACPEGGTRRIR